MITFKVAVKAFIVVDNNKLLLLKRNKTDFHKGGEWDIPGGRLEGNEDAVEGLQREILEECGLEVQVLLPVEAHSFTRDDGQHITMLTFLCVPTHKQKIQLSDEHVNFKWVKLVEKSAEIPKWYHAAVHNVVKFDLLSKS